MNEIHSRDKIREAIARALLLDAEAGTEAAVEAVAQSFAMPVEAVRECIETSEAS